MNPPYIWRLRISKSTAKAVSRKLDPILLSLSPSAQARLLKPGHTIRVFGAPGEYIYFGVSITNLGKPLEVSMNLSKFAGSDEPLRIDGDLKIVTSWAQSGKYTAISKRSGFITHELLLDDDRNVLLEDSWRRSGAGWVYHPPEIARYTGVRTRLLT